MKVWGEFTVLHVTPKEQVRNESLRQTDSYLTQLWREFTISKPPKKQVLLLEYATFWYKDRDF